MRTGGIPLGGEDAEENSCSTKQEVEWLDEELRRWTSGSHRMHPWRPSRKTSAGGPHTNGRVYSVQTPGGAPEFHSVMG